MKTLKNLISRDKQNCLIIFLPYNISTLTEKIQYLFYIAVQVFCNTPKTKSFISYSFVYIKQTIFCIIKIWISKPIDKKIKNKKKNL